MKTYSIIATGILSASGAGFAQESCTTLAQAIVYNDTRNFSRDEIHDIRKAQLCSERYEASKSNSQSELMVGLEYFKIGFSNDENRVKQEQEKLCQGNYGDYWSRQISSSSAKIANSESLRVVQACLQLQSKGLKPTVALSPTGKSFSMTLRWDPSTPDPLTLYHAGPMDLKSIECKAQVLEGETTVFKTISQSSFSAKIAPSGSYQLSCTRQSRKAESDGESLTCYDEVMLSVASNGPAASIFIPEMCLPNMRGGRASAMEARLGQIERKLAANESEATEAKKEQKKRLNGINWATEVSIAVLNGPPWGLNSPPCKTNWLLECSGIAGKFCHHHGYVGGVVTAFAPNNGAYVMCLGRQE